MDKERIERAIEELETGYLSEDQQHLLNYLRANIDDIEEALAD